MKRFAVVGLLAACSGHSGTVSVTLTTAPGSHVLDDVTRLRVEITNPQQIHSVEKTASGFDLSLDFAATGETTAIWIDGVNAADELVASGASPSFTFGPLDGKIQIYMAPPATMGEAPVSLAEARTDIGTGELSYGALLAGGRLASGAPSDVVAIYNAFDHSLVKGLPLPAPRRGLAVGMGNQGIAYLFGGADDTGAPTANLWRFDTTVAPAGAYIDFGDKTGFARADERAVPIGSEHFLLTGMPVGDLNGLAGTLAAKTDVAALPSTGAGFIGTDGMIAAIFAGPDGITRFHGGMFTSLDATPHPDAVVVALHDGKALVVCGAAPTVRVDAAASTTEVIAGVPSTPRTGCAVAATSRYLVIAGGTLGDGSIAPSAEVFDLATLAPVATPSLVVPRSAATAMAMPNGQVLVAGGVDATGAPIATLELFTPANSTTGAHL